MTFRQYDTFLFKLSNLTNCLSTNFIPQFLHRQIEIWVFDTMIFNKSTLLDFVYLSGHVLNLILIDHLNFLKSRNLVKQNKKKLFKLLSLVNAVKGVAKKLCFDFRFSRTWRISRERTSWRSWTRRWRAESRRSSIAFSSSTSTFTLWKVWYE